MCDRIPPIDKLLALSKNWYDRSNAEFGIVKNNKFRGPLKISNWLIPGILLVGEYPSGGYYFNKRYIFCPKKSSEHLRILLDAGIDTFVCLNDEYGIKKSHFGYAETEGVFNKYGEDVLYNASGLPEMSENFDKDRDFIHMPIKDMNVGDSVKIKELCKQLKQKICEGKHLYIHCTGGHGRTGTVAAILLYLLYPNITAEEALEYIQYAHDQRDSTYGNNYYVSALTGEDIDLRDKFTQGQVPTPQTTEQRNQVRDIIRELQQEMPVTNVVSRQSYKPTPMPGSITSKWAKFGGIVKDKDFKQLRRKSRKAIKETTNTRKIKKTKKTRKTRNK